MKKLFLVAIMAVFTSSAFAQLMTGRSASLAKEESHNWGAFFVEYNPGSFSYSGDLKGVDDQTYNGVSLGVASHISLGSIPLYFDYSFGMQFTFATYENKYSSKYDIDYFLFSYKMPLGLSYMISIPNTPIDIIPNSGIDLRLNIVGTAKQDGETSNLFSKDDMGGKDNTWNMFQAGMHVGCDVRFWKKLLLGFQYQFDFNEIATDSKCEQVNLRLGVCF